MDNLKEQIAGIVEPLIENHLILFRDEQSREIQTLRASIKDEQNRIIKNSDYSNVRGASEVPFVARLFGTSAATSDNYGYIFTANKACQVTSIKIVYKTAGTDAGAVTLQIEKLQNTIALGSGDTLLSYALSLKATAATVYSGSLANSQARFLREDDRLALKLTGTPTSVADLCVTIGLKYE